MTTSTTQHLGMGRVFHVKPHGEKCRLPPEGSSEPVPVGAYSHEYGVTVAAERVRTS